ncbi:MAG: hypothetical protein CSA33_08010 [Desulfobulbus propionicus]|nr:MAG: hypothetical protein CSA33_08010 [Desulfobulbus propionicus]
MTSGPKKQQKPSMFKTTPDIQQKHEADRKLALLVLANKQSAAADNCLSEEQMAALVEGKASAQQTARHLSHLAGCNDCYSSWQFFHRVRQEERGNRPPVRLLRFFLRPKSLAAAGSLLAAAASIMVFLNISVDESSLLHLQTSETVSLDSIPAMENEILDIQTKTSSLESLADASLSECVEKESAQLLSEPSPQSWHPEDNSYAPNDTTDTKTNLSAAVAKRKALPKAKTTPWSLSDTEPAFARDKRAFKAMRTEAYMGSMLPSRLWLLRVEESCKLQQPPPEQIEQIIRQGEQLLKRQTADATRQKQDSQVEQIIHIFKQDQISLHDKCLAIRSLLTGQ